MVFYFRFLEKCVDRYICIRKTKRKERGKTRVNHGQRARRNEMISKGKNKKSRYL